MIQTGGGPETLAALLGGSVDAAGLVAPGDSAAGPGDFAMLSTVLNCAFPTALRKL